MRGRPLAVRARPRMLGLGDAWGSLRLFCGLREARLGENSLCLCFESLFGPGPLSLGRRKEQHPLPFPPSPRCICPGSRRAEERVRGGRGPGGPGPAAARCPPACLCARGAGKRLQGRLAELLAERGGMAVS